MMIKPNFLFIGPDKSGSTWLYEIFKEHPQIFVPDIKDIYFFDRYYYKGWEWYASFFKGSENYKAIGELSHDYMFSIEAMLRIRNDLPGAKLFVILRNPFEKVVSHYLFLVRSGITNKPFEIAIKTHKELIEKCLYAKYLSQYINIFPKEQFKIFFYDDLKKDPRNFAKDIFDYLNVDFIELDFNRKVLPASKPRIFLLAKLAKKSANLLRELGWIKLLGKIKANRYIQTILYKPYKSEKFVMSREQFEMLFDIFVRDIRDLEKIVNKKLDNWLEFKGKL